MTGQSGGKIRVAILGGGIAALTAAFELTEQDPRKSRYDITLYTLGWRLGGKAAVGRDMTKHGRAVEHGIHIWAGYYDNAFDIVKRLYARLNKKDPMRGRNALSRSTISRPWNFWRANGNPGSSNSRRTILSRGSERFRP